MSLESSVTLEDIFTVVEAKRVPLAPELAGYLSLEVADGTDAGSGDVDPKTVFVSEEGTVALVRPKKDSVSGDAEASVRKLLAKLLDASGSGTPALTTAARRKPGNGLPALVEELEAALIPVNRAAGRRALARLAREVKRVLLGVGRNASVPPVDRRPSDKSPQAGGGPGAGQRRPAIRKRESVDEQAKPIGLSERPSDRQLKGATPPPLPAERPQPPADVSLGLERNIPGEVALRASFDDEAGTAKRSNQLAIDAGTPAPEASAADQPRVKSVPPPPIPNRAAQSNLGGSSPRPPGLGPPPIPKRDSDRVPVDVPPPPTLFGGDEVDSLLDSFGVSSRHEDKQMARELKAIAGLSPTPPPPDARTLAELTKDVGKDLPKKLEPIDTGDSIEALLALTDPSRAAAVKANDAIPPVVAPPPLPPPPLPIPPANLPPSSIFGGASGGGAAAGAPASLRQAPEPQRAAAPAPPSPPLYGSPNLSPPAPYLPPPEPPRYDPPKLPRAAPGPSPSASGQRSKAPDTGGAQPAVSVSQQVPTKRTRSSSANRPRAPRTGLAMLIFALLVLGGGTAAIWKFAPQVFTGKKRPVPTAPVSVPATVVAPPKCKVALVLTEVPANAEILLRMGQAPVDVERMPVGTRLELVATAEGYAPRRAVIRGEAQWDKGPDGKPRIEVPIQLDPSKAKPGALDPWPAAEPGSQVGGSGAPGTVHVVSNVRGAEVWLLAGLGPEARIDQLRCDADIDVLFAGPPTLRKRLHVSEKDISATAPDAAGNKVVNINAK